MQITSMHFKARAGEKLRDTRLQQALAKAQGKFVHTRAEAILELENFEAYRDAAASIRDRVIRDLDLYLEQFEKNASTRGAVVHWAETAQDVNRIVCEIAELHGVRKTVK